MQRVVTLYRPIGPEELDLIRESGWRRFPPRLAGQPLFYPVVQEEYAARIARDWNVKSHGSGFVTRFSVDHAYLEQFACHPAGGTQFTEYWIPAEELDNFNRHLRGPIELIAEFHAEAARPSSDEWTKAYDLAEDRDTIERVQKATLTTREFGLVPEVALFGSTEWWQAIEDGRIPKHEVTGTISSCFMAGHGDWPEFELDSEGGKTLWTRFGRQDLYEVGRVARVEYVLQKSRNPALAKAEHRKVLRIYVRPRGAPSE